MPKKLFHKKDLSNPINSKQKIIIQKATLNKPDNISIHNNTALYNCGVQFEPCEILENISKDLKLIKLEDAPNLIEIGNILKTILTQIFEIIKIFK